MDPNIIILKLPLNLTHSLATWYARGFQMALQSLSANYTDSDEDLSLIEQPKHQNTHKSISSDEENEIKLEKSPRQSVANVLG